MKLRAYEASDIDEISKLFYETVHKVCDNDYSEKELDAWASGTIDKTLWNKLFLEHHTIVAVSDDKIVGFGDMDNTGYLDKLYIHKDFQSQGIATAIVNDLEKTALSLGVINFTSFASITAKPFFEKMGYTSLRKNIVTRNEVELINYEMRKFSKVSSPQ